MSEDTEEWTGREEQSSIQAVLVSSAAPLQAVAIDDVCIYQSSTCCDSVEPLRAVSAVAVLARLREWMDELRIARSPYPSL